MTKAEADLIFKSWQQYIETADKFSKLTLLPPPSFLPYPINVLEEALNIVAMDYFEAGDKRTAEDIQRLTMLHIGRYYVPETGTYLTDEEALEQMLKSLKFILDNPRLKETVLENLASCQQSWIDARKL